jgi:membrane protease YdiL (CAAX protease family)
LVGSGVDLEGQDIAKMFFNAGWLKIIILAFMTVVIAPILEEFIFRHTLYRNLSKKFGRIAAAIFTSGLFAMLHYNVAGTISFFGVGLYNCYLYDKYGYRASVLNHFVFNFISTFFIILLKIFNINVPV